MSKRIHVLFDSAEYRALSEIAKRCGLSTHEWVRRAILESIRIRPVRSWDEKLKLVQTLASHSYPSGDIENILSEIGSLRSPVD